MSDRHIFRYVVPIDEPGTFALTGDPVAVAASPDSRSVEFWAEHTKGALEVKRTFQVFSTGHPIPAGAVWTGTCPRTSLGLVWHLYELQT